MKLRNRKVTIYDIAKLSGASPSTVSAALNGTWKSRRIGEKTVAKIQRIAEKNGYSTNMQARGLRQARSGMIGMIIPVHDNRFFSSLSQSFDSRARQLGLCPVIASTLRDPEEEARTVETLISYSIDSLFITGAADPDALSELCAAADLPHIYIDLPGKDAPSIVSNNYDGAAQLTRRVVSEMPAGTEREKARPFFLGGSILDYATALRFEAFCTVSSELGYPVSDEQVIPCGYAPREAARAVEELCNGLGGLPTGLFVNSLTAFEGVMSYFVGLPPEAFTQSVIGCYDYDPFAAYLQFPVYMVRQNADGLVAKAFELYEARVTEPILIEIEPELVLPRTIFRGPYSELG